MHTVESYATNLGLKIDKPEIYEKYYPVGDFEYITLYLGGSGEQIHYHHWQDVISLAFPMLEKQNIKIIQLNGALQQKFNNCINVPESLSCNNLSYIIKNSKLHISENSLDLEIASMHDKNIIYLDPTDSGELTGPYWNKESKSIYLNKSENIKNINKIKPEKICRYIFDFLNMEFKIDFETVFIGDNYQNKTIQFIPDQGTDINVPDEAVIIVRMDKFFDEKNLASQLSKHKCIIVTNKKIDLNLLQQLKQNVHHIAFFIEKEDSPDFIYNIQSMGISYVLMTYLDEEKINPKKINYLDNDTINPVKVPQKEDVDELKDLELSSLYYISNGPVLSNFKIYKSVFDYENRNFTENPAIPTPIVENPDFWKEINNFHILKKVIDTKTN